jgi:hypothetical protein
MPTPKTELENAKEQYSLSRIDSTRLDKNYIIGLHQIGTNELARALTPSNPDSLSKFASALRALESNIHAKVTLDDRIYFTGLLEKIKESEDIVERADLYFKKYDRLNEIEDNKLVEIKYATLEGDDPGAVSQWIAADLMDNDSCKIIGFFGGPRRGKSTAAGRLALNITKLTGRKVEIKDLVYKHEDLLRQKSERRMDHTLKGSVQIMDEGGVEIADASKWFNDEVRAFVDTIKTQGFDNTCTIIVSPMFTDIVKKARGLFHATFIPWKEWGARYMLVKDTTNIDKGRGLSSWKLDLMDLDPITGEVYPDKLKAALGDIWKVDFLNTPTSYTKRYKRISEKWKEDLQHRQLGVYNRAKSKRDPDGFIEDTAHKIAKLILNEGQAERYGYKIVKTGARMNLEAITTRHSCGDPMGKRIRRRAIEVIKEKQSTKEEAKNEPKKDT